MNHTPGPWILVVGDSKIIATFRNTDGEEENRANYRLIASAPELLDALKEILKGEGAFSRDPLTHAGNTITNIKTIARDAIANVTS
jgi:hypothetical protein